MYYTVIDDEGHTCGHKHKAYNRAIDCYDKLVGSNPDQWDILGNVLEVTCKDVDFEYLAAFWAKYGQDMGHTVQQTMDKLYPA
jgi:hypothetical protein